MAAASGRSGGLGTFGGVFTPSILTILGLILFLRLGYVVGNAGLWRSFAILALATSISLLTSLSLAAIATNRKVRGGGDYYLISRSLGVAYGGALGLLLFVAQAVSVAFYCVGFGEGVSALLPGAPAATVTIAAGGAAVLLLALAWVGADLATRFQYAIMAILLAALVSFFAGGLGLFDPETLSGNRAVPGAGIGFWPLFAIFFPAVTGFTQGVSMSGDLEDAGRSLPRGTLGAVAVATVVYAAVIVVLAGARPGAELASDPEALKGIAAVSWLVDAGILAATLSSALASFLGAPRILQALAADRVFPLLGVFAVGSGPAGNPRRAVLATGAIAGVTIAAGNLNAIAGVVSMFFLISYALLNYATYVEATAASPSFRPRFRFFHARASLLGTGICAGVMLAIGPVAGAIAAAVLVALYQYVRRTAVPARWRDSRHAYRFRRVAEGIREIAAESDTPGDWQPQLLVFTEGEERRARVLRFASWMAGGSGMITAVRLLDGDATSLEVRRRRREAEQELRAEIADLGLDAHALALAAPDLRVALTTLVQAWGIGPIRSNTVLLNWLGPEALQENSSGALWYARLLRNAIALEQNAVVLDADETSWVRLRELPNEKRRIDLWWFDDESSRLTLLLAHLMTRSEDWDEASLRVLVPSTEEAAERTRAGLEHRLQEVRIAARIEAVTDPDLAAVVEHSRDAGVVLLPLRIAGMRLDDAFGFGIHPLLSRLPVVALVAAAQDIRLGEERDTEVALAAPESASSPEPAPETPA